MSDEDKLEDIKEELNEIKSELNNITGCFAIFIITFSIVSAAFFCMLLFRG
jgi:hypothetical protein